MSGFLYNQRFLLNILRPNLQKLKQFALMWTLEIDNSRIRNFNFVRIGGIIFFAPLGRANTPGAKRCEPRKIAAPQKVSTITKASSVQSGTE
jgi:hypothetical protein